ncbi:MAG: hypothetical protein NVSMB31_14910 [Vulcanimicrobiaceae bacterium]
MPEWISYETADAPPLEISIDVDLADDHEFRAAHPNAIVVTVKDFDVSGEGQPDDGTAAKLYDFEEVVEATLDSHNGALACTVSGSGAFRLYGYAAETGIDGIVRNAIASLKFRSDVQGAPDPAWTNYDRYALRGEELEEARDSEQLDQLQESGEDLSEEFDTAFYINFDSVEQARGGAKALAKAGFEISSAEIDSLMEGENEVMANRSMNISPDSLKEARAQVNAAVAPFGGRYNGWGAYPDEE